MKLQQVQNTPEAINALPKTTIVVARLTEGRLITRDTPNRMHMHLPPDNFAAVLAADDQWDALMQVCEQGGAKGFRALPVDAFVLAVD